jgi:chaperonin GroES
MATQFPALPEDFDEPALEDTEGALVALDDEPSALTIIDESVQELPDGSAVVMLEETRTEFDGDFYSNLADGVIDRHDLGRLATRYLDLADKDKTAREDRDKQYEEGLRRTGLGNDAPGGANFQGANKVVHPIMAEACVDFESRAIKELMPPDGPVRTKIIGDADTQVLAKAERKRDYLNWQLTEQIEEFRDEMEQMLTQVPLGGSQFLKLWYDEGKRRPCAEFVPIDNILLPYSAVNFYTAGRVTEVQDITELEFDRRIASGLYADIDSAPPSEVPTATAAGKANNKIEGREEAENVDGERRVYHIYTWLELDDDPETKGERAPYILMLDESDNRVLGLYRNWDQEDETRAKLDWLVEFKFIPWRGAYAIGLPHLIGGLAAALTGSLRALLDTAHINNSATMLKLKGAKISGQSQSVDVTQITEIEGAPGVDDVRKIAMPMPFNPPSPVLFQLLGWLTDAAKGVVTSSEEKIADVNSQAPVGTTQALIEQGAAVYSAIHTRMHNSQARLLRILCRLNRWYIDDQIKTETAEALDLRTADFDDEGDIAPVSDPHIFSETQRMAQTQAIIALDKQYPGIMDPKAVVARTLKQLKVQNYTELMPKAAPAKEQNAAEENVEMVGGKKAQAYQHQDHLGHLQAHLDFATNPIFGSNPIFAPDYLPLALEHMREHMVMWYRGRMQEYVEKAVGHDLEKYYEPILTRKVDQLFAVASSHVMQDAQQTMQQVAQIVGQLLQTMQQAKPQPPMESGDQAFLQASMAETQRKAAKDQTDAQLEAKRIRNDAVLRTRDQQIEVATNAVDNLTRERMQTEKMEQEQQRLRSEQERTAFEALQAARQPLPLKGL